MNTVKSQSDPELRPEFEPLASAGSMIHGPHARFTVLTSRLIRLEFSPTEQFEDRPSQLFWYRQQPVPNYETSRSETLLEITTEYLRLRYVMVPSGFTADTLSITLVHSGHTWRFGDEDEANLGGTTRTLDEAKGAMQLEPGLISRSGWALIDDSSSLVFVDDGWLTPRSSPSEQLDLYFFGYGLDFQACLHEFRLVAGVTPLLPRWALGNWWSRYWAYSHDELIALMDEFRHQRVPLSVCIVDMDWHLVDVGPGVDGWTGYTWNRDLFPHPDRFIAELHKRGLRTALNLHPALGVRPHEEMYETMAERLGLAPDSGETIPFDIADPEYAAAYFQLLHHPQESRGVDFWWIDWQQGGISSLPDLDPLWWLNHLHFYDLGRDGQKRPFIFSRWGGLGNHRYPIGFSGDTHVAWQSLRFQPYFTATAANVGYGWWSHDIGGHMFGTEDGELYTRWVQFGVFSPILRLHSTNVAFHERRPWGYDAEVLRITREAMQLRHALIPYLYTMSWHDEQKSRALLRPMYHDYPDLEEAFYCPQQYLFGSELLVAPFTSPADPDTRLSRQLLWLPEGDWYDFTSGERYRGNGWQVAYGRLDKIPIFAKAGAIVPLAPRVPWGGLENPTTLELFIFAATDSSAGSDHAFTLYEDDGQSMAYRQGQFCLTEFQQSWRDGRLSFSISPVEGDTSCALAERDFRLHVVGVPRPNALRLRVNDRDIDCDHLYDERTTSLRLDAIALRAKDGLELTLDVADQEPHASQAQVQNRVLDALKAFRLETMAKAAIAGSIEEICADPSLLAHYAASLKESQLQALVELILQAGVTLVDCTAEDPFLLLWNNHLDPTMTYRYAERRPLVWNIDRRYASESGILPRFGILRPKSSWQLRTDYAGLVNVNFQQDL